MDVEWTVLLNWIVFQKILTLMLNGDEPGARTLLSARDRVICLGDDLADAVLYAIRKGYYRGAWDDHVAVILQGEP